MLTKDGFRVTVVTRPEQIKGLPKDTRIQFTACVCGYGLPASGEGAQGWIDITEHTVAIHLDSGDADRRIRILHPVHKKPGIFARLRRWFA